MVNESDLGTMRLRVRSLPLLSGSGVAVSCGVGCSRGSDPRVAVAVVQASGYSSNSTPILGTSKCHRSGPRNGKKTKTKKIKKKKARKLKPSKPGVGVSCMDFVGVNALLKVGRKFRLELLDSQNEGKL